MKHHVTSPFYAWIEKPRFIKIDRLLNKLSILGYPIQATHLNKGLHFGEYLGIWFDIHAFIKENSDLLELAAERFHWDKILGSEFWEEEILVSKST